MVYFFEKSLNLGLTSTFRWSVEDEKAMKKEYVAKFWTIINCAKTENNNLIVVFSYPLFYKSKQKALEGYFNYEGEKKYRLLVLHTIDRYHFHWLDFYQVITGNDGKHSIKKLKGKKAFFDKEHQPIDENGNVIPGSFNIMFTRK